MLLPVGLRVSCTDVPITALFTASFTLSPGALQEVHELGGLNVASLQSVCAGLLCIAMLDTCLEIQTHPQYVLKIQDSLQSSLNWDHSEF